MSPALEHFDQAPRLSADIVEVTRRDDRTGTERIESRHRGHMVLTGPGGEVVAALGDPQLSTFVRSAVKPFQATACLEILGGVGSISPEEVAVAWASHRGEQRHLDAVARLLERSGTAPEDLTCPPATSLDDPAGPAERIRFNCSGKHALFALAGAALGVHGPDLLDPAGPLQREVLGVLEEVLGVAHAVAVDGCGAPAIAVPLASLASSFGDLAVDERWAAVRDAGLAHPGLVGGVDRAETALLAAGVLAKPGAEGVFGASFVDEHGGRYGVAVKVEDGASRAAASATVGLLEALGVIAPQTWRSPPPTGGGQPVGQVRPSAAVLALADQVTIALPPR